MNGKLCGACRSFTADDLGLTGGCSRYTIKRVPDRGQAEELPSVVFADSTPKNGWCWEEREYVEQTD